MNFRIPAQVKIKNKVTYEIAWVDSFKDPKTLGECRFEARQIVLKKHQSERETFKTFVHELLHAVDYERNVRIPHKLVYGLEDAIYYLIFHNKWDVE